MEQPNVNNLNGVPNFGHGISDSSFPEIPPEAEAPNIESLEPEEA